jgi:hypothetical protein
MKYKISVLIICILVVCVASFIWFKNNQKNKVIESQSVACDIQGSEQLLRAKLQGNIDGNYKSHWSTSLNVCLVELILTDDERKFYSVIRAIIDVTNEKIKINCGDEYYIDGSIRKGDISCKDPLFLDQERELMSS